MVAKDWIYEEPRGLDLSEWVAFKEKMKQEIEKQPERKGAQGAYNNALAVIDKIEARLQHQKAA